MKFNNLIRLLICLVLTLMLVFAFVSCSSEQNTDTSSDTNTENSDTGSIDSDSDTPTTHSVSFYIEGEGVVSTKTVVSGEKIEEPSLDLVKEGYHLSSWKLEDDFWSFDIDKVSSDIVLSASWLPNNNSIVFNANGGFGAMLNQSVLTNEDVKLDFNAYFYTGYTFAGWATTKEGDIAYTDGADFKMGTSSVTLYAIWSPNTNNLHFDGMGSDNSMESITAKTNETVKLPACTLTREDHIFLGWAKTSTGSVVFKDGDEYTMGASKNNTLYAVWGLGTPVNETINVISNGSSSYRIVYDDSDKNLEAYVNDFASYVSTTYGVNLTAFKSSEAREAEYEIVIGNARENVKFTKNKLNATNDFAIDVCKNDLIVYATSEYLYSYLFDILKTVVFDGKAENLTIAPENSFLYSKSEYASLNYAEYLKKITGAFDYGKLQKIFMPYVFTDYDGTVIPYRIYVPSSYDPSNPLPVVTILHGAGERGNDNISQLKNMVSKLFNQENSPYANAIVICPQCPSWPNQWVDTPWESGNYDLNSVPISNELTAVVELLGTIGSYYSTDMSRYYVMGLSMGGFGTYDLLMRYSSMFAAGVVMCGCADVNQASELAKIPIHAVHGTNDTVTVPYSEHKELADAIESITDNQYTFETLQGYGHNVWDYVGDSTTIAKWLFEQSK